MKNVDLFTCPDYATYIEKYFNGVKHRGVTKYIDGECYEFFYSRKRSIPTQSYSYRSREDYKNKINCRSECG